MINANRILIVIAVITVSAQACRKSTDGTLFAEVSSNAVVGPGPSQPQPGSTIIKFKAYAQLSLDRKYVVAVAAGNKILFAGGMIDTGWGIVGFVPQSRVDIFDVVTLTRTTAELSQPRWNVGAAAVGNKIYFAGGYTAYEMGSNRVDIYDVSANTWSTATLSQARADVAVSGAKNKVIFAGGKGETVPEYLSSVIDILNLSNNSWTTGSFASNRGPVAASAGNIIAIAGYNSSGNSNARIHDISSNVWSSEPLYFNSNPSKIIAAGAAGKIIFGATGGPSTSPPLIRILNTSNSQWSQQQLTGIRKFSASCATGNYAFILNRAAGYLSPPLDLIDIYNASLDKWYQQKLKLPGHTCASTGTTLMVKGDGATVQAYTIY